MPPPASHLKIKAQFLVAGEIALGPGKAELLEWLDRTGSISAAAKGMGLSYRRAWLLVDTMNRAFASPLVATSHGGSHGGGANLTDTGRAALAAYRELEAALAAASHDAATAVETLLAR